MVAAAQLAFDLNVPAEDPGRYRLPTPERDEYWVRRLFEAAVGGFYDTVLSPKGWRVKTGSKINWQVENPTAGMSEILPSMKTDIILEPPEGHGAQIHPRTIIDTKFANIVSRGQYGENDSEQRVYIPDVRLSKVTGKPWRSPVSNLLRNAASPGRRWRRRRGGDHTGTPDTIRDRELGR